MERERRRGLEPWSETGWWWMQLCSYQIHKHVGCHLFVLLVLLTDKEGDIGDVTTSCCVWHGVYFYGNLCGTQKGMQTDCASFFFCTTACIYQADELREGHPHSDHHLFLPVKGWSDLQVVVLKKLLMKPSLYFWGSWVKKIDAMMQKTAIRIKKNFNGIKVCTCKKKKRKSQKKNPSVSQWKSDQ